MMITFNNDTHLWEMDGVGYATSFKLCTRRVWLLGAIRKVPAWARWVTVTVTGIITVWETRPLWDDEGREYIQQGFGNDTVPMAAILGGELASGMDTGLIREIV